MLDNLIETGLSFPAVLLTYCPGSNIGNMQFFMESAASFYGKCHQTVMLFNVQSVIKNVKKMIPTFHTRAMRTAMFEKFAKVSGSVKPAILRYFYKDLTGMTNLYCDCCA